MKSPKQILRAPTQPRYPAAERLATRPAADEVVHDERAATGLDRPRLANADLVISAPTPRLHGVLPLRRRPLWLLLFVCSVIVAGTLALVGWRMS